MVRQDDREIVVGVLYLNKYVDEGLSTLEEFGLNIFATQAANALNNQDLLLERRTWTEANIGLAKAISAIIKFTDIDKMLQEIVIQASALVGASFSYLAVRDETGEFVFSNACPDYVLLELQTRIKKFNSEQGTDYLGWKRGITGLAAKRKKPILIYDIKDEKRKNSEEWQNYVDFKKNTRSELAVPIITKENDVTKVIAVINVEHINPYAFSVKQQEVIELFASQVAIALQKYYWYKKIENQKNRLFRLQQAGQQIAALPSDSLLLKAVQLTCAAIDAQAVVFIPMKVNDSSISQIGDGLGDNINYRSFGIDQIEVMSDEIVTNFGKYHDEKRFFGHEETVSMRVFKNQKPVVIHDANHPANDISEDEILSIVYMSQKFSMQSGVCLPLISKKRRIGVMWIHFPKALSDLEISEEDILIFQSYADQIALTYDNAQQSAKLKKHLEQAQTGITKNINRHYIEARVHSTIYFLLSIVTSIAGIYLAVLGIQTIINGPQAQQLVGAIATAFGVLFEAASVLVFTRANTANDRADKYHKELFIIRQLDILLTATEQLTPELVTQAKINIINTATRNWFNDTADKK